MVERKRMRSRQAAYLLDLPPDAVIRFANAGVLKGERVGRFWYFTMNSVTRFKKRYEELKKIGEQNYISSY